MLITAATAQWHDGELIRSSVPDTVTVRETTTERDTLIVTGPTARDVLSGITDADLSQGWLTHQFATVAGQKAFLIRVSFAGELGWEIHAENAAMPPIYDAVLAAGAKPFGMYALNALRMEKGYRTWKGDLSTDYTPEASLTGLSNSTNRRISLQGSAAKRTAQGSKVVCHADR